MSIAGAIIFAITFILMIFGKVSYSSRWEQKHIESLILQMLIIWWNAIAEFYSSAITKEQLKEKTEKPGW